MSNSSEISILKKDIKFIEYQISSTLSLLDYLRVLLETKKKDMHNICKHEYKKRKREEGPYGERYWYCPDCELEF